MSSLVHDIIICIEIVYSQIKIIWITTMKTIHNKFLIEKTASENRDRKSEEKKSHPQELVLWLLSQYLFV